MKNEILEQAEEIILADGQKAILIQNKNTTFNNILIVELDGILRVIDKETKTLAQTLGETQNKHAYYVKKP
ncbi:hypothetical protein [Lactococcus lactis]|uniref:hypothetical protein n=1 Tax=Lactococcus lactis TaxID=1358 RepID=UPI0016520805|nr:hypothetical protein [Lactococcus lactis]QNL91920.1 hypothetical protein HUG14_11485 [Lactococcus lactis]